MSDVKATLRRHMTLCRDWLVHSIDGSGGSRAHFSPLLGWSRPYPETSGYIATTLLDLSERLDDPASHDAAVRIGDWLLSIREREGCWRGGLYPYKANSGPSVFNTGQILNGLVALSRRGCGARFGEAAADAARWLARGVDADGIWEQGHYRGHQPDYYSFVAWPMLDFADHAGAQDVRAAAERVVRNILANLQPNGTFLRWGFDEGRPAFTHTIAYTLQGLIESHRFLGPDAGILPAVEQAMGRLRRQSELGNGRLAGTFDLDWKADKSFECLTGTAQVAICLLLLHRLEPDLRHVNAAAKLLEHLCALQATGPVKALSGAVAGSKPLWGKYMRMRYPNWAVKFFADSLMLLDSALDDELRGS
jgi:hypothetical protein